MDDIRRIAAGVATLALLAPLAACADERPVPATALYRASGTVLENRFHGPQLCRHVQQSNPPTCTGLDLVGWNWAAVEGELSEDGTTWGGYEIVGGWDGTRMTVEEVRLVVAPIDAPPEVDRPFPSPCPEPAGGWRVIDPAKTTSESWWAVMEAAKARPDYGGDWIDQPRGLTNDLDTMIINIRVTGSIVEAERDLRQYWGGALCVSPALRTEAEARSIEAELVGLAGGAASASYDVVTQTFEVDVTLDDGTLQTTYDQRYGPGTVTVRSWLQPVE